MQKFVISFYAWEKVPYIKHPKWWQFNKKAELCYRELWVRHGVWIDPNDKTRDEIVHHIIPGYQWVYSHITKTKGWKMEFIQDQKEPIV